MGSLNKMIFEQLSKLEPGWAGDDSIAPIPLIIQMVREFYHSISIKPEVHADPHGNIELVWPYRHLYATVTLTDVQYERLYPDSFRTSSSLTMPHHLDALILSSTTEIVLHRFGERDDMMTEF